jgi:hypothetical protein
MLEEFYERIKWLKGLGYKVPDYLLPMIEEEMRSAASKSV